MDKMTPAGGDFRRTGNWRHWNLCPRARHSPIRVEKGGSDKTGRLGNDFHSIAPRMGPDPPCQRLSDRPASSADILTFKGNDNPELGFVECVVSETGPFHPHHHPQYQIPFLALWSHIVAVVSASTSRGRGSLSSFFPSLCPPFLFFLCTATTVSNASTSIGQSNCKRSTLHEDSSSQYQ